MNAYMQESERRQQEYVGQQQQRNTDRKLDVYEKEINELKLRLSQLEHVLALVVEKAGMGHRVTNEDGSDGIAFTGPESSLAKSRTRGRHLRIDLSGKRKRWLDETTSN
jgi:hypothetical protein